MVYFVTKFFEPEIIMWKLLAKTGREEEIYLERIPKAICFSLGKPRNNSRRKPGIIEKQLCPGKRYPFWNIHRIAPPSPNPSPESVNPSLNTLQKLFLNVSASQSWDSVLFQESLLIVCPKSLLLSLLCALTTYQQRGFRAPRPWGQLCIASFFPVKFLFWLICYKQ